MKRRFAALLLCLALTLLDENLTVTPGALALAAALPLTLRRRRG